MEPGKYAFRPTIFSINEIPPTAPNPYNSKNI